MFRRVFAILTLLCIATVTLPGAAQAEHSLLPIPTTVI